MKDLLKCDGRMFSAKIEGEKVSGKITVEDGYVYLCQDMFDGKDSRNKRGYKYSWSVRDGSKEGLENNSVSEFRLIKWTEEMVEAYKDWMVGDRLAKKGEDTLFEVIFRSGELVVLKSVSNGVAGHNFTVDELYNLGFRIVPPKVDDDDDDQEIKKLTMEEIAEKFGLPVENIRIKED